MPKQRLYNYLLRYAWRPVGLGGRFYALKEGFSRNKTGHLVELWNATHINNMENRFVGETEFSNRHFIGEFDYGDVMDAIQKYEQGDQSK